MLLAPLIAIPQVLGVLFWDNFAVTVFCTVVIGLLFVLTYLFGIKMAKNARSINE